MSEMTEYGIDMELLLESNLAFTYLLFPIAHLLPDDGEE